MPNICGNLIYKYSKFLILKKNKHGLKSLWNEWNRSIIIVVVKSIGFLFYNIIFPLFNI